MSKEEVKDEKRKEDPSFLDIPCSVLDVSFSCSKPFGRNNLRKSTLNPDELER